jgi:outer membrane lipoprotein-sorting protein
MRFHVVLPLLVLAVLAQSCATNTAVLRNKSISSDQIHGIVLANQIRMQTVKGEGTISVETATMAQSGSFALTLRKPDSLLVNLRGPFGIKIGSALLTRKDFWFYSSLENRVFTGETSPQNLSRVLRVNLSFDDLLNLFTGGVFQQTDFGTPDQTGVEDEQFILLYKSEDGTHKYYIDPQILLITKIQNLDDQGKLLFEQRFVNFQNVDSTLIPFNIRILQPKERRLVSVVYSDLEVNKQDLEFTFSYPRNAEQVHWQ